MLNRFTLAALAIGLLALTLFFVWPSDGALSEREAYEQMLAEHPYATRAPMTREEVKALPKQDRPDLAAEQNFLLIMDPETGDVPIERLFEANRRATEFKRLAGGPLVTSAWEERGPSNVGGRTRGVMFDPNDPEQKRVWAGGVAGGLWFTEDITDEDAEWQSVNDFWSNLAVSSIAYDPTDTDVFYVGTGEGWFNFDAVRGGGIFKSEDGGATFEQLPSTTNQQFWHTQDLLIHPTTGDVYAATRESGLQRSQDDGATWERVLGAGVGASTNRSADLEIGADNRIYVSLGIFQPGAVHASTTGDLNDWTELSANPGFPTSGIARVEIATAPTDANVIYALTHETNNNGAGGIYRSDDAGATWTEVTLPDPADPGQPEFTRGQAWYDLIIEVDPNDANTVFTGGIDLYKSTDGGATWEQISDWVGRYGEPYVHADQHQIVFKPGSSDEVVFGNDGGIFYTADATETQPTFIGRNNGYNVTQYYAGAISPEGDPEVMLAGAQDNGTQRFDDEGINATLDVRGGDGAFAFIDQDNSNIAIASSQFNNYSRSTNGGLSFSTTLISEASGSFINPADYDDRENVLYTNRDANTLYRVTGVDQSTQTLSIVDAGNRGFFSTPTHLRVSPHAPEGSSTLFVGTSGGRIFRVLNADTAPELQALNTTGLAVGSISCIEIGESEDHLLVTLSNYGRVSVWETTDGGETWMDKEGNLPDMPVRWAVYNPTNRNAVLLATESGVWETLNFNAEEPTWTPAPGFPTVRTDMLQWRASDNRVMAATHGRGVFTATFLDNPVSAEETATVAKTHTLEAAYPNPFAERASFELRIAEPQEVRVEVYNTLGQRVATLHDGPVPANALQRFTIDGRDLASGTYLYVVTGERFRDEGRVTLVR